jgi:tetratricopeptide (TPR) repeat protein
LPLASQFTALASLDSLFSSRRMAAFRDSCARSFEADRRGGSLSKMVLRRYFKLLTLSRADDRRTGASLARHELGLLQNVQRQNWMIRAAEWEHLPENRIPAYFSFCTAMPYNYTMKLRLSTDLIRSRRFADADSVLKTVEIDSVKYNADLHFCRGALYEWKGKAERAIAEYRACIAMRRYRPEYFERYGALLAKQGRSEEAAKMSAWARQISIDGPDSLGNRQAENSDDQ